MATGDVVQEHGRDRRKRLTRQALRRSALELGLEHGLGSVSIDAIAERAGVSARTFFNYFESKEEAALLGLFQVSDPELKVLAQGDASTAWSSLTALFADDLARAVEDEDLLLLLALQEKEPALASRQLATFAQFEAQVSTALIARLGGSEDARIRAPLMVGCCFTAVRVALHMWAQSDRNESVRLYLGRALSVVAPAFTAT